MEEAYTHFGGISVGGWRMSMARRISIFTTTQEASGSGLCQGRSMKVNRLNIFLITLIIEGQPLLTKASAQPCPHTDDGVPWKYRSTKGRMENDDRSLDLGCGKEAYLFTNSLYWVCLSVGECILSHSNQHTIGSEPKLKEGAETEVARLQFQMGKCQWQWWKATIWQCLTPRRKDWSQREKPRFTNAEDLKGQVRGQRLPIPERQRQWGGEVSRTLSRAAKVLCTV